MKFLMRFRMKREKIRFFHKKHVRDQGWDEMGGKTWKSEMATAGMSF
jgi:hypothetical protein